MASAYDAVAEEYDDHYADGWSQVENRLIGEQLDGVYEGRGRILDLGCGTGLVLDLKNYDRMKYVGVDVSREMLRRAVDKHPEAHFVRADIETVIREIAPRSFSAVVGLFGVLSYFETPLQTLREIRRVLRPGGSVLLMAYTLDRLDHLDWLTENVKAPRTPYTVARTERLFRRVFPRSSGAYEFTSNYVIGRAKV